MYPHTNFNIGRPSKEDTLQRIHAWLASEGLKATCQALESEAPQINFFGQVLSPRSPLSFPNRQRIQSRDQEARPETVSAQAKPNDFPLGTHLCLTRPFAPPRKSDPPKDKS